MKPLFLDNPPRYTRAARTGKSAIDYGCAVERVRSTGYSTSWWAIMVVLAVVTVAFIVTGRPA